MNAQPAKLLALTACCLLLNGCVVAAAADLAATTVMTVGKVAVKGTGAVVRAAIPDGDKNAKQEQQKGRAETYGQPAAYPAAEYRRIERQPQQPASAPDAETVPGAPQYVE